MKGVTSFWFVAIESVEAAIDQIAQTTTRNIIGQSLL